jgi:hypothetical protein
MTVNVNVFRYLLFAVAALVASGIATAAELETRTSSMGGVTVNVTAKSVAPGAADWEFGVVLTTHSGDLSDDLVKDSVLIDAKGGRHAPLAWEGASPGGHHRSGVLRFKGLAKLPDAIELQIRRPGEAAPRSFRWKLK